MLLGRTIILATGAETSVVRNAAAVGQQIDFLPVRAGSATHGCCTKLSERIRFE